MPDPREYHVGDVVRYKPHHPGHVWDEEVWWVVTKTITKTWGRPVTIFYHVAKVADPSAVWRVDTCVRADMLRLTPAPVGFHVAPQEEDKTP